MEKKKIGSILVNFELGIISFDEALSLLGESTEVVSSALSESSDLYDVRECNASGEQIPNEALVEGALEKITDHGSNCPKCKDNTYTNGKHIWCGNQSCSYIIRAIK